MQSLAFGRNASRDADRAGRFVRRSKEDPAGNPQELVSLLGNQAVQDMLSGDVAPPVGCACSACAARDDDFAAGLAARTEPLEVPPEERGPLEEPEEPQGVPSVLIPAATPPSDGGLPDPATMGGTVICSGGALTTWINPTMDPCVVDCARRHEEKHVADFTADPDYRNACAVIPEGHSVRYGSSDDARRFETAATDLEIACLNAQYAGASAACQPVIAARRDTTLPNYKRSFSRGC